MTLDASSIAVLDRQNPLNTLTTNGTPSALDTLTSHDAFSPLDIAPTHDAPHTIVAVDTLDTLVVLFYVTIAHGNSPGKDFSNVKVFWWTTLSSFLLDHFHRFEVVGLVLYCIKKV